VLPPIGRVCRRVETRLSRKASAAFQKPFKNNNLFQAQDIPAGHAEDAAGVPEENICFVQKGEMSLLKKRTQPLANKKTLWLFRTKTPPLL